MAKKTQSIKALRQSQRNVLATTILLVGGLVIVLIGWMLNSNAGQLLIGFGAALLLISAVLYWNEITR
jgi:hypothetical protein